MRALNDCIKEDKSKADKMFEELGYEKKDIDWWQDYYEKEDTIIEISPTNIVLAKKTKYKTVIINKELLQAINEKCKELGWLDKEK